MFDCRASASSRSSDIHQPYDPSAPGPARAVRANGLLGLAPLLALNNPGGLFGRDAVEAKMHRAVRCGGGRSTPFCNPHH